MQTNATHGVRINPENNNLIFEINCFSKRYAEEYYCKLLNSLVNLLKERDKDFCEDTDTICYVFNFLQNILPTPEQIKIS